MTRAEALALGALVDMTETACENGIEMTIHFSQAAVEAYGTRSMPGIILAISQIPELCEPDVDITLMMISGSDLHVARESIDGVAVVTVTLAAG